jgi:ligand-binding sensor domain-containing protein
LARPGSETRILPGLLIFIIAALPCFPQQGPIDAAKKAFARGDIQDALEGLRRLRSSSPDQPVLTECLALSVQYSLAAGDPYKASYFLRLLQEASPGSAEAFEAGLSVGGWYYDRRSWRAALEYFSQAVDGLRKGAQAQRKDLALALLRSAEISLYFAEDTVSARLYFSRIVPSNLPVSESPLYREMGVRLLWRTLSPRVLGLDDANISSLTVDGDDLWVGTWNGGVSRYSVSSSHADPFPLPSFSRSIEIADRRVWIGTAEGLAWYGKSSGRWGAEGDFQSPTPRKVQVVREAAGSLYVGTLGDGLFRRGDTGWDQVSDGDLPGKFITCIAAEPGGRRLFIGTMNLGLVIYDPQTGAMSTLAEAVPAFTAENIGTILLDSAGRVWIGTYGDGLSMWWPSKGTLRHFSRATKEISDDWVLASCETDRALYFGSFGGGVGVYLKETDSWKRLGIRDGLASLDVAAIAWRSPYVFFGTLGAGVSVYDEEADAK